MISGYPFSYDLEVGGSLLEAQTDLRAGPRVMGLCAEEVAHSVPVDKAIVMHMSYKETLRRSIEAGRPIRREEVILARKQLQEVVQCLDVKDERTGGWP